MNNKLNTYNKKKLYCKQEHLHRTR